LIGIPEVSGNASPSLASAKDVDLVSRQPRAPRRSPLTCPISGRRMGAMATVIQIA
jgi:hypothetical protein